MNFTCPHCGMAQIVNDNAKSNFDTFVSIGTFKQATARENLCLSGTAIRCANPPCNEPTVFVMLSPGHRNADRDIVRGKPIAHEQFYPKPVGKPFPDCVPAALLEDYKEAWSIINLSPKSSATLARRCLQAMIRDFCGIRERTLFNEIETLEKRLAEDTLPKGVDADTIEAMRALKDVGNIGAHMTQVDGVIVEVEAGEAEALLGLIEMLFSDWYVTRDKRQQHLAGILAIAAAKKAPTATPNT